MWVDTLDPTFLQRNRGDPRYYHVRVLMHFLYCVGKSLPWMRCARSNSKNPARTPKVSTQCATSNSYRSHLCRYGELNAPVVYKLFVFTPDLATSRLTRIFTKIGGHEGPWAPKERIDSNACVCDLSPSVIRKLVEQSDLPQFREPKHVYLHYLVATRTMSAFVSIVAAI